MNRSTLGGMLFGAALEGETLKELKLLVDFREWCSLRGVEPGIYSGIFRASEQDRGGQLGYRQKEVADLPNCDCSDISIPRKVGIVVGGVC